jgi:hypothetical protein
MTHMKSNAAKQLARQIECAKEVGIYDAMFLAFGALLGYVREGDMIEGDDDLDVGFISEMITADQEKAYVESVGKPCKAFPGKNGLFEYRRIVSYREDNGRLFWLSLRGAPSDLCFKCCHWFFWKDKGYAWHSKGRDSLVKGIPAPYLEIGPEVEFLGVKIHIPKRTGSVLDFWYTDWMTKRLGGNSARKILMKEMDWAKVSGQVVEKGAEQ